jgi:hypothetical protein
MRLFKSMSASSEALKWKGQIALPSTPSAERAGDEEPSDMITIPETG